MRKLRLSLRAKMAVSYVLVTAAVVVAAEAVTVGMVTRAFADVDRRTRVQATAKLYAAEAAALLERDGRPSAADTPRFGEPGLVLEPGQARAGEEGGVRIPYVTTDPGRSGPMSLALLLTPERRVVASSFPPRYPPDADVTDRLPAQLRASAAAKLNINGVDHTPDGDVVWAIAVVMGSDGPSGKPGQPPAASGGAKLSATSQSSPSVWCTCRSPPQPTSPARST
jgi:hypothetical protein